MSIQFSEIMDKLDRLGKQFADGDQDTIGQINSWRSQVLEMQSLESYRNMDITKKVATGLKEMVKNADIKLSTNRKIPETERLELFILKDVCRYFLSIIDVDFQKNLKSIDGMVDDNLEDGSV